jgi:Ras-related protein Rab-8A
MGVVIAYDCTDEVSFSNVKAWLQQVRNNASPTVVCILVATKCDRPDRKVTVEQGAALAAELNMRSLETSAKSNINILETFLYLAREIRDQNPENVPKGLKLGEGGKKYICC